MAKNITETTLEVLIEDAKEANDVMLLRQLEQIKKETDQKLAEGVAIGLVIGFGSAVIGISLGRILIDRFVSNEVE
jgi:hypothetical protein